MEKEATWRGRDGPTLGRVRPVGVQSAVGGERAVGAIEECAGGGLARRRALTIGGIGSGRMEGAVVGETGGARVEGGAGRRRGGCLAAAVMHVDRIVGAGGHSAACVGLVERGADERVVGTWPVAHGGVQWRADGGGEAGWLCRACEGHSSVSWAVGEARAILTGVRGVVVKTADVDLAEVGVQVAGAGLRGRQR